jgi:eukaryotic-like serine/threonine-protein kinase
VSDVSFSKDGQWIAYIKVPGGDLWRSRVDGSEELSLTSGMATLTRPQWSPDGKRIAFFCQVPNGRLKSTAKIFLVSADGGAPPVEAVSKDPCLWPSWSPDGNSLIFSCYDTSFKPGLYILDLKTHQMSTIPESGKLEFPNFTSDGRYVIANDNHQISLFDLRQQRWRTLVTMEYPYWSTLSRDGQYVYFRNLGHTWKTWWDPNPAMTEFKSAGGRAVKNSNGLSIFRVRLADRKLEKVASLEYVSGIEHSGWFSLAPDDSPLVLRNMGTQEIYALDWEAP